MLGDVSDTEARNKTATNDLDIMLRIMDESSFELAL
jgi:hypothetical protein